MRTRLFSIILLLVSFAFSLPVLAADRINVSDYGTDTNAINYALTQGTSIYFPAGTYTYTGSIVVPANTSYRFYGDGPGVSTIVFTGNPYTGFYGYNMGTATLEIDGLTLQANSKNCGTGIYALWNQAGSNEKFRTAIIHNVQIIGSTRTGGTGTYWTGGIYLNRAQNAVIDKVEINGNARDDETGGGIATQFGIVWVADGYRTTGLQLSNIEIYFCNTGLQAAGSVEGVYATGFEFAFCGLVNAPAVDLSSNLGNLGSTFHLVNGHVSALENGIRLTSLRDVKISKLHFIHVSGSQYLPYVKSGIDLALYNCTDAVISDSSFDGVDGSVQDETGIYINGSEATQVIGNYFTHYQPANYPNNAFDAAIAVEWNSTVTRIINNVFSGGAPEYGGVGRAYYNAAPDTYFRGNNL